MKLRLEVRKKKFSKSTLSISHRMQKKHFSIKLHNIAQHVSHSLSPSLSRLLSGTSFNYHPFFSSFFSFRFTLLLFCLNFFFVIIEWVLNFNRKWAIVLFYQIWRNRNAVKCLSRGFKLGIWKKLCWKILIFSWNFFMKIGFKSETQFHFRPKTTLQIIQIMWISLATAKFIAIKITHKVKLCPLADTKGLLSYELLLLPLNEFSFKQFWFLCQQLYELGCTQMTS